MADAKEAKVAKVDVKTPVAAEREGLLASWVSQSADLAERTVSTGFGIVRDVRGELNQRVLAAIGLVDNAQQSAIKFVDSAQQGAIKLARVLDERVERLAEDSIDTAESLVVGIIRAVRDTGHGVTDLANNFSRPREGVRAA
jgi:hypothetical protein